MEISLDKRTIGCPLTTLLVVAGHELAEGTRCKVGFNERLAKNLNERYPEAC